MIDDIDRLVKSAVDGFFGTMLNLEMQPIPAESHGLQEEATVAGSVGFIGKLTGVMYVYTSVRFAHTITATLLGMPPEDVNSDAMVNDAVGEMANMLVGQLKSALSDRGVSCVLTIPSVVRGTQLTVQAVSSTERRFFSFKCQENTIFIDLLIRPVKEAKS